MQPNYAWQGEVLQPAKKSGRILGNDVGHQLTQAGSYTLPIRNCDTVDAQSRTKLELSFWSNACVPLRLPRKPRLI